MLENLTEPMQLDPFSEAFVKGAQPQRQAQLS